VLPYDKANHPPVVNIKQSKNLNVKAGERIKLVAIATDPDKNTLSYKWWQYHEVDSYAGKLILRDDVKSTLLFTVPSDARPGDDIHIILTVTDNGTPALTRYKRVVVSVK
jgi:hypothetical protein